MLKKPKRIILCEKDENRIHFINEHYPEVMTVSPEACADFVLANSDHDLGLLAAAADPDAGAEYHCQTNRCKMENLKLQINDLSVAYTPEKLAVKHVTTGILERTITAIFFFSRSQNV